MEGFRGEVGATEDRRRWLVLPSHGADMECGGRGHPHLIFSLLFGVACSDRQNATVLVGFSTVVTGDRRIALPLIDRPCLKLG
jgi:hypothetical protein